MKENIEPYSLAACGWLDLWNHQCSIEKPGNYDNIAYLQGEDLFLSRLIIHKLRQLAIQTWSHRVSDLMKTSSYPHKNKAICLQNRSCYNIKLENNTAEFLKKE